MEMLGSPHGNQEARAGAGGTLEYTNLTASPQSASSNPTRAEALKRQLWLLGLFDNTFGRFDRGVRKKTKAVSKYILKKQHALLNQGWGGEQELDNSNFSSQHLGCWLRARLPSPLVEQAPSAIAPT